MQGRGFRLLLVHNFRPQFTCLLSGKWAPSDVWAPGDKWAPSSKWAPGVKLGINSSEVKFLIHHIVAREGTSTAILPIFWGEEKESDAFLKYCLLPQVGNFVTLWAFSEAILHLKGATVLCPLSHYSPPSQYASAFRNLEASSQQPIYSNEIYQIQNMHYCAVDTEKPWSARHPLYCMTTPALV